MKRTTMPILIALAAFLAAAAVGSGCEQTNPLPAEPTTAVTTTAVTTIEATTTEATTSEVTTDPTGQTEPAVPYRKANVISFAAGEELTPSYSGAGYCGGEIVLRVPVDGAEEHLTAKYQKAADAYSAYFPYAVSPDGHIFIYDGEAAVPVIKEYAENGFVGACHPGSFADRLTFWGDRLVVNCSGPTVAHPDNVQGILEYVDGEFRRIDEAWSTGEILDLIALAGTHHGGLAVSTRLDNPEYSRQAYLIAADGTVEWEKEYEYSSTADITDCVLEDLAGNRYSVSREVDAEYNEHYTLTSEDPSGAVLASVNCCVSHMMSPSPVLQATDSNGYESGGAYLGVDGDGKAYFVCEYRFWENGTCIRIEDHLVRMDPYARTVEMMQICIPEAMPSDIRHYELDRDGNVYCGVWTVEQEFLMIKYVF